MSAAMGSLAREGGKEEREFGSPGERMKGIGSACSWSLPHRNEERKRMDVLRAGEEISRWLNGLHIRFCCEALARPLHILEV